MSISAIQRRRLFEEVTRVFYASGEKPRVTDILAEISRYFAKYPAGVPLRPMQGFAADGRKSDVSLVNEAFYGMQHNLSVAYEAALEQTRDIMMITSMMQSNLERLRTRRSKLVATIDDYLFTLFNADGYFMSISDTFDDLSGTDLRLTSAFVDNSIGRVSLPTNSSLTRPVPINAVGLSPSITVLVDGERGNYRTLSPFLNAFDGLDNTIWAIEVETSAPAEVIMGLNMVTGNSSNRTYISRIEIDPWGIQPVQTLIRTQDASFTKTRSNSGVPTKEATRASESFAEGEYYPPMDIPTDTYGKIGFHGIDFDRKIQTSATKMIFNDTLREVGKICIMFRKKVPDYSIKTSSGATRYRYIFGVKDITLTEHVYDQEAVWVSSVLNLPAEVTDEHVIDAVSLIATSNIPSDTSLTYWVAPDLGSETADIGDYEWKKIVPLEKVDKSPDSVVKFNGALTSVVDINSTPEAGELQLIAAKTAAGTAPAELNPSPYIIQGTDVWRLAEFQDSILPSSAVLEEGINTVRVLHVTGSTTTENDLSFWTDYLDGTKTAESVYTRIDRGTGFFDGASIGEDNRFVYVETFLETEAASELILRNLRKGDTNARNWDVKVYLNGREVGDLPVDTDFLAVPWKFVEGLNHIIMLITIPVATDDAPRVYDGKILLMDNSSLYDFGTVKLATWTYVDFFHMQYNEVDTPFSFTIREVGSDKKEIISRRKPTDNFRFRYAKSTGNGPTGVRLKVDLKRSVENPNVSPSLDLYRMRFLYA